MKKLCLALIFAALLLTPATGYADPVTSQVRVSVRKIENDRGFGSGVVLSPGIVLTAQHVAIEKGLHIDNGKTPAEVIVISDGKTLDIALLRYPAAEARCPCARLADSPALLDEKVYVVGYPWGIAQVVTIGTAQGTQDIVIQSRDSNQNLGKRLVLVASVGPGNSGGGVFVYREGAFQLVGILVEGHAYLAFAIPLEDIKTFISANLYKL